MHLFIESAHGSNFLIRELRAKTFIKFILKQNSYLHNVCKDITYTTENNKAYVLTP